MLSDTPDVEQMVGQVAPALERGRLVIDMSTIAPSGAGGSRNCSPNGGSNSSMRQYRAERPARSKARWRSWWAAAAKLLSARARYSIRWASGLLTWDRWAAAR